MPEKHPYHCVLCGGFLEDIGLGLLACPDCGTQYLPTINDIEGTASLTRQDIQVSR